MSKKTPFEEASAGLTHDLKEIIKTKNPETLECIFKFLRDFMDHKNAAILAILNPMNNAFDGVDMLTFAEELSRIQLSAEEHFINVVRDNIHNLTIFENADDKQKVLSNLNILEKFLAQILKDRETELNLLLTPAQVLDQP